MRLPIFLALLCWAFFLGSKVAPTKQLLPAPLQKEVQKIELPQTDTLSLVSQVKSNVQQKMSHQTSEPCKSICTQQERPMQRDRLSKEFLSEIEEQIHLTQDERKDIQALVTRLQNNDASLSEVFFKGLSNILGDKTTELLWQMRAEAHHNEEQLKQQRLSAILAYYLDIPKSEFARLQHHIIEFNLFFSERRPTFRDDLSYTEYSKLLRKAHADMMEDYFINILNPEQSEQLKALIRTGLISIE